MFHEHIVQDSTYKHNFVNFSFLYISLQFFSMCNLFRSIMKVHPAYSFTESSLSLKGTVLSVYKCILVGTLHDAWSVIPGLLSSTETRYCTGPASVQIERGNEMVQYWSNIITKILSGALNCGTEAQHLINFVSCGKLSRLKCLKSLRIATAEATLNAK
jgi:hypothetical protein